MKKLILILFAFLFAVCGYAQNVRQIIQTNDILTAQQQPKRIGWWQGETIQYDIAVERGGDAVSLSTGSTFAVWYVTSTSSLSLQYIVNTGILANATGGLVRITTTASEANLATGTYFSSVRLYDVSGGVTANVGTVARGLADVFWSPDYASYSIVTGQVVTTLVFNVTLNGSTNGGAGSITQVVSGSSTRLFVTNGIGPNVELYFDGTGLATGTPLYVEAFTGSVGSIAGLATGTPLYVEADAAAIAQVGTASNALRVSIGLNATNIGTANTTATNLQVQITTNLTRLGLAETNTSTLGVVVTNNAGAISTNLTRLGLLETNHIGQGVSLTNAHGAISTNLTRLGLAETNHTGLGVSVTNNAGAISTNLTRLGALETNHLGLGVSVTNVDGRVTTNLSAQGLIATNLTQVGLVLTNLSGRVTTNYTALGLLDTNHIATGLAVTNLQGLVSSNHIADGLTQTNLQGQITTNLVAAGLIRTNLTQVGLVVTNLSGLVTTNFTAQGLVQSNLAVVAAQVTNNLVLQGAIDTNLVALTTNAVSKTWTNGQEMAGALHSRDRLSALTNLTVAATNATGSEILNNGSFTGSEAGWSLTNASYNANSLLVLPSATASITYTQAVITAGKVYQLSFANTLAYGSNFTLFAISIGGYTNVFAYAPTGTHTMTVATWTEQPLVFRATPGTNQLVLDTVSLKEDVIGDLWVARRGVFGREVNVGGNITVASNITAGTISGNATGYVPLVGGSMTGPLTNSAGYFGAGSRLSSVSGSGTLVTTGTVSGVIQVGYVEGTMYVGHPAAGVAQFGRVYGTGVASVGATAYGVLQAGSTLNEGTMRVGAGSEGAHQQGYTGGRMLIDDGSHGSGQFGYNGGDMVIASGTLGGHQLGYVGANSTSTVSGAGALWVGALTNGNATVSGPGAIGIGKVTATNEHGVMAEGRITSLSGFTGDGSQLTNLTAANLAAGGTFGALNAINLTNLPSAATTAGVNSISHTGAVSSDLTFTDGTGVDVSQTNATFYWSVIPGAVSGIDGRTLTNAVPMNLGTGAVALASLGNVAQTGQVNSITYTGGTARGNITFSGSGVSQTGAQDFVFTAGVGGTAIGIFSNGTFVANSTNINFVGSGVGQITGNTVNISGGGGGDYWQTNRFVVNEGADRTGIIVTFTNNVAQRIPMFHVCYQNGITFDTNTFGFNAPFSNHLYAAHWKANDGNGVNHGAIVYLARNGAQWNFDGQNTNNLSNTGCRFFSGVEGSDTDHGGFIGGRVLFRPQTNNQEFAATVIIFSGGTWSLFNSQLEVEDLGPIVGSFEL